MYKITYLHNWNCFNGHIAFLSVKNSVERRRVSLERFDVNGAKWRFELLLRIHVEHFERIVLQQRFSDRRNNFVKVGVGNENVSHQTRREIGAATFGQNTIVARGKDGGAIFDRKEFGNFVFVIR